LFVALFSLVEMAESMKVSLFNGSVEGFPGFLVNVEAVLMLRFSEHDAYEYVIDKDLELDDDPAKAASQQKANKAAFAIICQGLKDQHDLVGLIEDAERSGRALLAALKARFAPSDNLSVQQLNREISDTKPGAFANCDDWLSALEAKRAQARATKSKSAMSDDDFVTHVTVFCPDKLKSAAMPYILGREPGDGKELWRKLCTDLRRAAKSFDTNDDSTTRVFGAYAAGFARDRHGRAQGRGRGRGGRGGGGYGTGNDSGNGRRQRLCWECGSPDHIKANCPKVMQERARPPKANLAMQHDDNVAFGLLEQAAPAPAMQGHSRRCEVSFNIDSGASRHVCGVRDWFGSFRADKAVVQVVGGQAEAQGVGHIKFTVTAEDGSLVGLQLRDVLFIPGSPNLLSGVRLTANTGHELRLGNGDWIVLANGCRLPLWRRGRLLHVDGFLERAASYAAVAATASPLTRHCRLGHRNTPDMKKMGELAPGEKVPFCEPCAASKMKRAPVAKKAMRTKREPGELVVTDFNGPMEVPSLSGARYALLFVDVATRYKKLYLVKSKKEGLAKYKDFVGVMRQLGVETANTGATLQGDNDSVFQSKEFRDYCKSIGVQQRFSPPHTQAKNGIVERAWNTLLDSARTLLKTAVLPKEYWGAAMLHATFVNNVSASSSLGDDVTPFELVHGYQFDLKKLRIFGCQAYVHVPRGLRLKFDAKSRQGVYFGYRLESDTHAIYMPDSKRMQYSAHVRFNEAKFGPPAVKKSVPAGVLVPGEEEEPMTDGEDLNAPLDNENGSVTDTETGTDTEASIDHEREPRRLATTPATDSSSEMSDAEYHDILGSPAPPVHAVDGSATDGFAFGLRPTDPTSLRDAYARPDGNEWRKAVAEELQSLMAAGTWTLVPRASMPHGARLLRFKYVLKTKLGVDGEVERYKARLCVQGFSQREGIDYKEVFAPVARYESIRVLLALAAGDGLLVHQMDVKSAFLNAALDEELYMAVPPGLHCPADMVCRLDRALYGLKQSPRCWNRLLSSWMTEYGFQRCQSDSCVFVLREPGCVLIVLVWVDDLVIAGNSQPVIDEFKAAISKRFKMTDLGLLHFCLGMRICQSADGITLDQEKYVGEFLEKFGMADSKAMSTPLVPNSSLHNRIQGLVGFVFT